MSLTGSNGRSDTHDSFSSEGLGTYSGGGGRGPRSEMALPPPGVLSEIDMQEINRIFVCSDRLNRCFLTLHPCMLGVLDPGTR